MEPQEENHEASASRGCTAQTRRLLEASTIIAAESPARIAYQHAVLCQVGLPRRRTAERVFERRCGHARVRLEAGVLYDGQRFIEQPLPYGVIPRLLLIHFSTLAVRAQSREIELEHSVRGFLRSLGMSTGGGERGGYAALQRQLRALGACRITIGLEERGRAITVDSKPVTSLSATVHEDQTTRQIDPRSLVLSQDYFETLTEHAVPLDPRALAALRHSSLALDIYTWLTHRLRRVQKPTKLSWMNLKGQFGQEYGCTRDFKRAFRAGLRQVLVVYPQAQVRLVMGGLMLYPSCPPVRRV